MTESRGMILAFLWVACVVVAYTSGFRRGRSEHEELVGRWVWGSTAGSDVQRARGQLAELCAYGDGEWEIQPHDVHGPYASGQEADQVRAQIRAMRVYRTLTEQIASAEERR